MSLAIHEAAEGALPELVKALRGGFSSKKLPPAVGSSPSLTANPNDLCSSAKLAGWRFLPVFERNDKINGRYYTLS